MTPQRLEIIKVIAGSSEHPSAGMIFRKTRENISNISMSTVYSTLNLLKEEDLIKELEFYEQENRYESDLSDHIDLICVVCGKIENYYRDIFVSPEALEISTGFKAHRMRFEYYGICRDCRQKKA